MRGEFREFINRPSYFYENLYMKFQVLYPLIAIVIIQILRNTPRANWEMLKNENACGARKSTSAGIFITQIISSLVHLKEKWKTFPSLYSM